jgi:hypothetical protein
MATYTRGSEIRTHDLLDPNPQAPTSNVLEHQALTDPPPNACTNACTGNAETPHGGALEQLAAALLNLPAEDRAKLAAMLMRGGQ